MLSIQNEKIHFADEKAKEWLRNVVENIEEDYLKHIVQDIIDEKEKGESKSNHI